MPVRTLDPRAYGFPTRCFVCEPDNAQGLRIPYTYDDEARVVSAEFTLGPEYSGTTAVPPAGAGLVGVPADRIDSQVLATGTIGADGKQWIVVH